MSLCYILIILCDIIIVARGQISLLRRRPFQREIAIKDSVFEAEFNSTSDYIEHYGYTAEQHSVISPDGFLLALFRIPSEGSPILFQHGLLLASDSWVLQGPQYDLAFILADKGYDIWLADNRGNTFSRAHLRLSPKSSKFWNFSFHEMGFFDMPAVINYILQATKREKVDIIGHSIGATSALIMCSTLPEYNEKVRSLMAIAPGVFFNSSIQSNVQQILKRYEPYLKKPAIDYARAVPRGVSYKTLIHLSQLSHSGKLSNFDYGPKTNIGIYGSRQPPEYNLTQVSVSVALLYSDGDVHVSSQDVELLKLKLPNVVANYHIDKPTFNHMDFIWGSDATEEVNAFILEFYNRLDHDNSET